MPTVNRLGSEPSVKAHFPAGLQNAESFFDGCRLVLHVFGALDEYDLVECGIGQAVVEPVAKEILGGVWLRWILRRKVELRAGYGEPC